MPKLYAFVVSPAHATCAMDFVHLDLIASSVICYANVKARQTVCEVQLLCSEDVLAAK